MLKKCLSNRVYRYLSESYSGTNSLSRHVYGHTVQRARSSSAGARERKIRRRRPASRSAGTRSERPGVDHCYVQHSGMSVRREYLWRHKAPSYAACCVTFNTTVVHYCKTPPSIPDEIGFQNSKNWLLGACRKVFAYTLSRLLNSDRQNNALLK